MSARETIRTPRTDRRMCLRCGFDGDRLQGETGLRQHRCPNCREDLYSRPPRSYRELESLPKHNATIEPRPHRPVTILAAVSRVAAALFRRTERPAPAPAAQARTPAGIA